MAKGDWVAGTTIQLQPGTQLNLTAQALVASFGWYAILPSGIQVSLLSATPYNYVADPTQSVDGQLAAAAQGLANEQGVPVVLANGQTVNPT